MSTNLVTEPAEKQVKGLSIDFQRRKCVCNWANCEELHKRLAFDPRLVGHPWADDFFRFTCHNKMAGVPLTPRKVLLLNVIDVTSIFV